MARHLIVFFLVFLSTRLSCGANISFMPGDAFFLSTLTEDKLKAARQAESLRLGYAVDIRSLTMGGHGGFDEIELTRFPRSMLENLSLVYRSLRVSSPKHVRITRDKNGNETATEINGFRLFVYPREANLNLQRLGLKYNENWMSLPPEAFKARGRESGDWDLRAETYVPLVREWQAVAEDWQFAKKYAGLRVQIPENVAWGRMHERISTPVTVAADEVQLVVLAYDNLDKYYFREEGYDFFVVLPDKIVRYEWGEAGKMITSDWNGEGERLPNH